MPYNIGDWRLEYGMPERKKPEKMPHARAFSKEAEKIMTELSRIL